MSRNITLLAILSVAAFLLWAHAGQSHTHAAHTFASVPPPDGYGFNWLHPDLEANRDHHLIYSPCGNPLPAAWITGVENWDGPLVQWQFDAVLCTVGNTNLFWDLAPPNERCPDAIAVACWFPFELTPGFHGSHKDLAYADIIFNFVHYDPRPPNEEVSIAAHEWGHTMSLGDPLNDEGQCAHGSIMGYDPICYTGPTPYDISSVRCNVYGHCGDFSGDTCTDVLVRQGGDLKIVRGNCAGAFSDQTAVTIGTGWQVFDWLLRPGDFNGNSPNNAGEACTDVIADETGSPYRARLYPGNCGQGGQYFKGGWTQIGSGWQVFSWVFAPGDFNGDNCPDVIFREGDVLSMVRGNCAGQFIDQTAFQISGTGWGAATSILGPGDWNADGCSDIIARFGSTLRLYRGNCAIGGQYWKDCCGIDMGGGVNWANYNWLASTGDFTGDGCMDLFSRDSAGTLRVHYGNCGTGFNGSGTVVGTGWNIFNYIY